MFKNLISLKYVKNVSVLMSGTLLAQIIPLLFEPILKRIYTPAEFGELSIFIKIFSIITICMSCSYELGVLIARDKDESNECIEVGFFFNILLIILLEILIYLLQKNGIISEKFFFYLLPLSSSFYSIGNLFNNKLIWEEKYKQISLNKFIRRITEVVFQILLKSQKSIGLIVGSTIGNFFYMLYNLRISNIRINLKLSKIKVNIFKYSYYPRYNLFPQVFNSLSSIVLDVYVLIKFSVIEVGYLELTQKILIVPSSLLGEAVSKVFLQNILKKINKKQTIKEDVIKITSLFLIIGGIYFIGIFYFSETIFEIIFGKEWITSAIYAKYMVFYIIVSFVVSPISSILIALKKFKINSIWQISKTTLLLTLYFINSSNIKIFILRFSFYNFICYIIYFFIILRELNKYEKKLKNCI